MTSVLRRYAQIEPRLQNMVVLADCSGWTYDSSSNITSSPVMSLENFTAAYNPTLLFLQNQLVKDLGRAIHVYDPANSNNLYQVYRQVMLVYGPGIEGISSQIAYVCTWSDDNTNALLARTG